MSIGDRIKQLRGQESRKALGSKIGIDQATIMRYENNQRLPDTEFVAKLCRLYNVSTDWLIYGDSTAFSVDVSGYQVGLTEVKEGDEVYPVPVISGQLSAGAGIVIEDIEIKRYMKIDIEDARALGLPKNLRAMVVKGDSMEPIILDNDLVLFDISKKEIWPGKIYAVAFDGYVYIKRIVAEPGKWILKSDNKQYSDITINLHDEHEVDSIKVLGRAVWWCHMETDA